MVRPGGTFRWVACVLLAALLASGGCGDGEGTGASSVAGGEEGAAEDIAPEEETTTSPPDAGPAVAGRAPPAEGGIPAVVTLEPAGDASPSAEAAFPSPVMDQFGLTFIPPVLLVPAGSAVTFTNSEGALVHNVHIRSIEGDSTVFNGDTAPGEELSVELPSAGGYDVLCDMHPGMTAFLFATDAPWATAAEPDGRFRIAGVAPGRYLVRVWTADGEGGPVREVEVTSGTTELDLTAPPG